MSSATKIKVDNTTLTKEERDDLLRKVLPACQPQEGSPANTFTRAELDDLQKAVGNIRIESTTTSSNNDFASHNKVDIRDVNQAFQPPKTRRDEAHTEGNSTTVSPQEAGDWHGAPRLHKDLKESQEFRESVRSGTFTKPTNAICPGFLQCNLVVLPQAYAFDFLLFCQRNPKACPLIEVCDVGSAHPHGVAPGADLRTDVPRCVFFCYFNFCLRFSLLNPFSNKIVFVPSLHRYSIYRDGKLSEEVSDVTEYWPTDSVAFLIGCSFSYDGALMNAGIPLKSAQQGKNVPMYKTNLKCRSAGKLSGNMVVSMKPIPALQISKHIEITSKYTHAHGGPVAVGSASSIGIQDIHNPEWGESIDIDHDEVPVFHACGVTPQSVLVDSKVPFAITHSAGHMFVTDLPADMGI